VVLRRWYGNYSCAATGGYGDAFLDPQAPTHPSGLHGGGGMTAPFVALASDGSDATCDGSGDVAAAVVASRPAPPASFTGRPAGVASRRTYNGFCLGGPDEWSYPGYRFDSAGARASVDAMIAATASDTVEVIVQWYYENVTSTEIYPITDIANPLRTSTDDELASIIQYAHSRGLQVIVTPMLDPDWTLPAQNWCRDNSSSTCFWRGELGTFWGDDCSPGSQWDAWFSGYTSMLVHYARLSQTLNVESFLISHELQVANMHCADLWYDVLAAVRAVFTGSISAAFESPVLGRLPSVPWVANNTGRDSLDYVGARRRTPKRRHAHCVIPPPRPTARRHRLLLWTASPAWVQRHVPHGAAVGGHPAGHPDRGGAGAAAAVPHLQRRHGQANYVHRGGLDGAPVDVVVSPRQAEAEAGWL
jgi:hypothetical protein